MWDEQKKKIEGRFPTITPQKRTTGDWGVNFRWEGKMFVISFGLVYALVATEAWNIQWMLFLCSHGLCNVHTVGRRGSWHQQQVRSTSFPLCRWSDGVRRTCSILSCLWLQVHSGAAGYHLQYCSGVVGDRNPASAPCYVHSECHHRFEVFRFASLLWIQVCGVSARKLNLWGICFEDLGCNLFRICCLTLQNDF